MCSWFILPLLALCATSAFTIALVMVDKTTLHSKYDDAFTSRSVTSYTTWGYVALVLAGVLGSIIWATITVDKHFPRRCFLWFACVTYIALLASGNVLSMHETAAQHSYEGEFAVKFNTFYCNVRTVRVCLSGDREALLILTRGSNATTVLAGETATDVAVSVWSRCQELLNWGIGATGDKVRTPTGSQTISDGVLAIDTKPLYAFLDDYGSSSTVDAWCSAANSYSMPMSDAKQRALPSPHATHSCVFASYKSEWSRRMVYTNAMLGAALCCVFLAAIGSDTMP